MSRQIDKNTPVNDPTKPAIPEDAIRVDGFAQVLAMLRVADRDFRESLLRRIADRDIQLAKSLRADLNKLGL